MSEKEQPYTLAEDEKATPVMVYSMNHLSWGEVVTKELVRVNTYLRTLSPDYVSLHRARLLHVGSTTNQPLVLGEMHIRTPQVIAFHLLPPAEETMDYDPAETNRMMEPVTALVGPFYFDAHLRISTVTGLAKHLEITSDTYISTYNVAISCPLMPVLGVIRSPLVLVRRDAASFAARNY